MSWNRLLGHMIKSGSLLSANQPSCHPVKQTLNRFFGCMPRAACQPDMWTFTQKKKKIPCPIAPSLISLSHPLPSFSQFLRFPPFFAFPLSSFSSPLFHVFPTILTPEPDPRSTFSLPPLMIFVSPYLRLVHTTQFFARFPVADELWNSAPKLEWNRRPSESLQLLFLNGSNGFDGPTDMSTRVLLGKISRWIVTANQGCQYESCSSAVLRSEPEAKLECLVRCWIMYLLSVPKQSPHMKHGRVPIGLRRPAQVSLYTS